VLNVLRNMSANASDNEVDLLWNLPKLPNPRDDQQMPRTTKLTCSGTCQNCPTRETIGHHRNPKHHREWNSAPARLRSKFPCLSAVSQKFMPVEARSRARALTCLGPRQDRLQRRSHAGTNARLLQQTSPNHTPDPILLSLECSPTSGRINTSSSGLLS
jgi:hypothetical protein